MASSIVEQAGSCPSPTTSSVAFTTDYTRGHLHDEDAPAALVINADASAATLIGTALGRVHQLHALLRDQAQGGDLARRQFASPLAALADEAAQLLDAAQGRAAASVAQTDATPTKPKHAVEVIDAFDLVEEQILDAHTLAVTLADRLRRRREGAGDTDNIAWRLAEMLEAGLERDGAINDLRAFLVPRCS